MVRGDVVRRAPPVAATLTKLEVRGFRSAKAVELFPTPLCALVGEALAGKSTLLAAARAVLDPAVEVTPADLAPGADRVEIRARLAGGAELAVEGVPPALERTGPAAPPVLFLPAAARSETLLASEQVAGEAGGRAVDLFKGAVAGGGRGSSAALALALVRALEDCCSAVHGVVILVEEPELFLRPQAQRHLYRVLRDLSEAGNQVIYSTHSPAFLNVSRLGELVFVERASAAGTTVVQPEQVVLDGDIRALTEFDAERSELFFARVVVLVEGATEKLALPFVFRALGVDVDREAISIVECGGKSGIPFFARICKAIGVPFLAVHDRDAAAGSRPIAQEQALNALVAEEVGAANTVVLAPDFEAASGLRGRSNKPDRAWRRFAELDAADMPAPLVRVVELAVSLAR